MEPNTPEAYENLLTAVMRGDHSIFVRSDEIEESWRIIDRIEERKPPVYPYSPGSYPDGTKKLIEKDGRSWHLAVK